MSPLPEAEPSAAVDVDSLPALHLDLDPKGRILYANPRVARVLGAEPGELVGQPMSRFLKDAGGARLLLGLGNSPPYGAQHIILRTRRREEIEVWCCAARQTDGVVSVQALLAPPDAVGDVSSEVTRSTERDVLSRLIRNLSEHLETDSVFASFWVEATDFLQCNQGYLFTAEDGVLHIRSSVGVNESYAERVAIPLTSNRAPAIAARLGEPLVIQDTEASEWMEPEVVRTLGVRSALLVPLEVPSKGTLGFGWGRRYACSWAHVEIAELLAALMSTILRYTEAVEHQRRAAESLERALRVREDVFAVVHHELRTPLLMVRNAAVRLRRRGDLPKAERDAMYGMIVEEADRLVALAEQALLTAEIDHGALELADELFDFGLLLSDVAYASGSPEIPVLACLRGSGAFVRGDPYRLRQVLVNLVSNALRYTPEGGKVQITLRRQRNKYAITVTDDGPGVAADDTERIFEKFLRGPGGSTGLGLYVARAIVEQHDGSLWCEPGPGGRFTFTLPRPNHGR